MVPGLNPTTDNILNLFYYACCCCGPSNPKKKKNVVDSSNALVILPTYMELRSKGLLVIREPQNAYCFQILY